MSGLQKIATQVRLACSVGFFVLVLAPVPAVGQQFREVAAGWTRLGPIPTESGTTYTGGPSLSMTIGGAVSQRFRFGFNGMAVFFDRNEQYFPPCPSIGCPHPFYDKQPAALIGVGGNGQFNVDARGRFFLDAGAGEYATFLQTTEFRFGVSGGAGISVPIGTSLLAAVQADWHGLLGKTLGPRNLFPISLGLRF